MFRAPVPEMIGAMSRAYRVLYGIGFTPWEWVVTLPGLAETVEALFEREEEGRQPPYGPVLDLGCGSGFFAVMLARRGWQVTGVDFIPKALRRARERVRQAGVEVRLIEGDVSDLRASGVGSGYPFLIDFGVFHDELTDRQRAEMGREVTAVAAPGATLLMVAWARRRRGPMPRGASRADIETAYPGWTVLDEQPYDLRASRFFRHMKADGRFVRLRRD